MGLEQLESRIAADLEMLEFGKPDWMPQKMHGTDHVYDVVIVGGGQSGLGAAFGLLREHVSNILVIDENPEGFEGPWDTYARMFTLRTPKTLSSIDLGLPNLTFRAWWEAQHGVEGWAAIGKIPRQDWMAYLRWYRKVLRLPVRNQTRLQLIEPLDGLHRLHLQDGAVLLTRKVILATGIQGGGQWHVPAMVAGGLAKSRYAHTSEAIDFAALVGKRIAILGGGASAFDNAQHALSHGVAEAHVFLRRAKLPRVNPIRFMERSGLIGRFAALDDAHKYAVMASFFARNQPPTNDTFARASSHAGFHLHLGEPWTGIVEGDDTVEVITPAARHQFDFLVLSTGLLTDPDLRPELRLVAPAILRWRDRYTPPAALANPLLDAHPYLGPGFELQGRNAQDAARLHGVFAFNYSALISLGISAAALSGLKYAIPRLVAGVANQLFRDEQDAIIADYLAYDEPEFLA